MDSLSDKRGSRAQDTPSPPVPVFRVFGIVALWDTVLWLVLGWMLSPVLPGGWLATLTAGILSVIPLPVLMLGLARGAYPSALIRTWLFRPFWYVQLVLPLMAVAGLVAALTGAPFGAAREAGRAAVLVVFLLFVMLVLIGYHGVRRLRVRTLRLEFETLPAAFDPLTIVQVSDLHVGPHSSQTFLDEVFRCVQDAEPDVIVITGDQVDDYPRDVEHFVHHFGPWRAPMGVYAVLGNHDVYAGWQRVRKGLEGAGITVLVNEAVPIKRKGDTCWMLGTGDPAGRYWKTGDGNRAAPDIERATSRVPEGAFSVALAHDPSLWPRLREAGVPLTLSGHTHYGQLAIPRLNWCLASPFLRLAMGLHWQEGSALYINPGTHYWGIPFRIGVPPEVTVITLTRRRSRGRTSAESSAGSAAP